jgi:hypothetical protein
MAVIGKCGGCGAEVELVGDVAPRVLNPAELQAFLDAHQDCRARVPTFRPFFCLYRAGETG